MLTCSLGPPSHTVSSIGIHCLRCSGLTTLACEKEKQTEDRTFFSCIKKSLTVLKLASGAEMSLPGACSPQCLQGHWQSTPGAEIPVETDWEAWRVRPANGADDPLSLC